MTDHKFAGLIALPLIVLLVAFVLVPRNGAGSAILFAGAEITAEQAHAITHGYSSRRENDRGQLFQAALVRRLLDQSGVAGIRAYYANHNEGSTLVLVAVDKSDRDMREEILLEDSFPCPPFCPEEADSQLMEWSKAGRAISLDEAQQMTTGFTVEFEGIRAHAVSRDLLLKLLAAPNVRGVRFWHARRDGDPVLVVVAVDKDGKDMLERIILESTASCPPWCSDRPPL